MSAPYTLYLPWVPTVNHYLRHIVIKGLARTLISKDGRAYVESVARYCKDQKAPKGLTGRLAVAVIAYPPDRRRIDLDNRLKPLLDSLTKAGVWGDDSQVDDLSITRGEVRQNGAIQVAITPLGGKMEALL